ncbi:hypothetical protein KM043_017537 [Ampulex compressa]|nr:hypothetical protein KM043_017537 [Ampulex compressa]
MAYKNLCDALNMTSIASLSTTKKSDHSLSKSEIRGGSFYRPRKAYASGNATMHAQLSHRTMQTDAARRFCGTYFYGFPSKDSFGLQSCTKYTVESLPLSTQAEVPKCRSPVLSGTANEEDEAFRAVAKSNVVSSRHSSVSSLSEEGSSLGSIEEWALLELCISSGIPKNKYRRKGTKGNEKSITNNKEECETITEDNYSICSYNSYVCKT